LPSHLLSKNINVKIWKLVLPVVLCGCGTWSVTSREKTRQVVWEQEAEENIWISQELSEC
jgi:hypothetical protein